MYSVIRNMRHTRALVAVAALVLVAAGAKHLITVHDLNAEYRNRPLARSLGMLMASVKPAATGTSDGRYGWAGTTQGACTAKELKHLEVGLARLDTELAKVTGNPFSPTDQIAVGNRQTEKAYRLDRPALDEEIQRAVLENDDGQEFRCQSLVSAVQWLVRTSGRVSRVAMIDWREQDGAQAEFNPKHHRVADPWADLPGCILMADAQGYAAVPPSGDKASARLCQGAFADGKLRMAARSLLPAGAEHLRAALSSVGSKAQFAGNTVEVLGRDVAQGPHYLTTLNLTEHGIAQQVANCYTGGSEACQTLGIDATRWQHRQEKAAVRMAGVLVLDIQSGAIEAAASAHTKCFSQEYDGPGRDADCVRLPTAPRSRPYNLENHALYTSYMPGSLVKPILAMGLLTDPRLATRLHGVERDQFLTEIRRSNTPAFLDRLFCKDKGFADCARPGYAFDAANALGWNGNCVDGNDMDCARIGRLSGAGDEKLKFFTGTMGLRYDVPGGKFRRMATEFEAETAKECSSRPGEMAWRRCRGGGNGDHLLDLESEAWGQGSVQATPVGIATMLSRLGSAANSSTDSVTATAPHLFHSVVVRRDGKPLAIPIAPMTERTQISSLNARLVLAGMAQSHLPRQGRIGAGTASSACVQVYGNSAACAGLAHVAGKTGTPPFTHDRLTAAARLDACNKIREDLAKVKEGRWSSLQARWVDCQHRPIKWYAALLKDPHAPTGPWSKVIVVIVERNWGVNGVIDSPGDTGPNSAAELAFQVIKRMTPGELTSVKVASGFSPIKN